MLEMRVLEPSGKVVGGAGAVLLLARTFWWARPLVWLAKVPGVFGLLDAAYHWGAAKRYCANGACAVPRKTRHGYLLLLPLGTPFVLRDVEPWVLMWAMAWALCSKSRGVLSQGLSAISPGREWTRRNSSEPPQFRGQRFANG
jgi:hypothetical protein